MPVDRLRPRTLVACAAVVVAAFLLATPPVRATGPTTLTPTAAAVVPVSAVTMSAAAAPAAVPATTVDVPARTEPTESAWLGRVAPPVQESSPAVTRPHVPAPPDPGPAPEVAPAPLGEPGTLARSEPTRVRIPTIGVDAAIMGLGLQADGSMEVPPGAFPAGWYRGAPTPGELGPAILAGHVDHGGRAGVFFRLRELRAGERVEVARADGSTAVFVVTRVEQHPKDAFPTAAVYGDLDHAGLRLITCGGTFDRGAGSYRDNIVVFARLDRVRDPVTG